MSSELSEELLHALGEDGYHRLTEAHGGLRLYVPADPSRSELPNTIGLDAATKLSEMFRGASIRVPLAREFRAARYRAAGDSNSVIARRLGITESGVDALFSRVKRKPAYQGRFKDPRQTDLFD